MKELYKIEFKESNNKKSKLKTTILAIFIGFFVVYFICTIYDVAKNYTTWKSYLKTIQPLLLLILLYYQYKNKGIYKRHFIITNEDISWQFDGLEKIKTIKWKEVNSLSLQKNTVEFVQKNEKIDKLHCINFTYKQLQEIKRIISNIAIENNIIHSGLA
jgi:hypothetical protein